MNNYKKVTTFFHYLAIISILVASILSFFSLADKVYIFFWGKFAILNMIYIQFYILFEDENSEKLKYNLFTQAAIYSLLAVIIYFLDFNPIER
jgi:hypothetical protein